MNNIINYITNHKQYIQQGSASVCVTLTNNCLVLIEAKHLRQYAFPESINVVGLRNRTTNKKHPPLDVESTLPELHFKYGHCRASVIHIMKTFTLITALSLCSISDY